MAKQSPKQKIADELAKQKKQRAETLTAGNLVALLKKHKRTTGELAEHFQVSTKRIESEIKNMQAAGILIYLFGVLWGIEKMPAPSEVQPTYESRADNTFVFGVISDNHLGSKYERLDVLNDMYDRFAAAGVDRVFNAGNWIDGEARFNKYDLHKVGMDNQLDYMAEVYPQREDIVTYAVAGDDHEGWYGQREGIDIGRHAEQIMESHGRTDWVNIGFMECFVKMVNRNSGESSQMLVQHPGGGSSYALSYVVQKIVESFEGGEKPAALISGHYHKLWAGDIRNVWCMMAACTQDQTPFMRKKRISAHVGGLIVKFTQDPRTGALVSCLPEMFRYFNKGYYNERWSHGGKVQLPKRGMR